MNLGDIVAKALSSVGITEDRVSAWIGAPCGCGERQQKLNELGWWARRALVAMMRSNREAAAAEFEEMTKCAGKSA